MYTQYDTKRKQKKEGMFYSHLATLFPTLSHIREISLKKNAHEEFVVLQDSSVKWWSE